MVIKLDPPVAGALIAFVDPSTGKVVKSATTDSEGKARIAVKPGTYVLYVVAPGYNPYRKEVTISDATSLTVNLADPDVVDPIYLYNKAGEVINPATEDTLGSILSHVQFVGGYRYKTASAGIYNYALSAGETYAWLDVSGKGMLRAEYAWKTGDGVDMMKVKYLVRVDGTIAARPETYPSALDYWGFGGVGKYNLGSEFLFVTKYDTSTGVFEAERHYDALRHIFNSNLEAVVINEADSSTRIHHVVWYLLFTASTRILMLADEAVNASDLRRYINFMHGRDLCESVVYRLVNITEKGVEAAKLLLEGRTPPEPYHMLTYEEAQLWLKLGEGKHHYVELTVDERRFKHQKEFWEFLTWLEKEFNMKLLDISMEALNIPDYIP